VEYLGDEKSVVCSGGKKSAAYRGDKNLR